MARVNRKNIEKIFGKIFEDSRQINREEIEIILKKIEKKNKRYDGEEVSDVKAIEIAFEKIKYNFSRIYGEGKAKSTLVNLEKCINFIEYEIENIKRFNQEEGNINIMKDLITHLEIALNLDVTFYTSLLCIYHYCLEKENLSFNNTRFSSERRNRR